MNGFVSHEKEKFEKIAREMQSKDRDLVYMDSKLRKVEELIKNSPVVQSRRVALKESTTQNGVSVNEKVLFLCPNYLVCTCTSPEANNYVKLWRASERDQVNINLVMFFLFIGRQHCSS